MGQTVSAGSNTTIITENASLEAVHNELAKINTTLERLLDEFQDHNWNVEGYLDRIATALEKRNK